MQEKRNKSLVGGLNWHSEIGLEVGLWLVLGGLAIIAVVVLPRTLEQLSRFGGSPRPQRT